MSKNNIRETKAKQALLYGNSGPLQILVITLLFLLNAALVLAADCFLIHSIPKQEMTPAALSLRLEGEVLDTCEVQNGMLVLYRTDVGELRLAQAREGLLGRYHLEGEGTVISHQPWVCDTVTLDYTVENEKITNAARTSLMTGKLETGVFIGIAFALTVLERVLLGRLWGG